MKIDQLLTEWREMNYTPTYSELLEVQDEQQELIAVLGKFVGRIQDQAILTKFGDLPAILKEQAA